MITKCRFCEFKREKQLSLDILKVFSDDMPPEDFILWMERLLKQHGFKDWRGVKVHMGRMHKKEVYYGMWPHTEFDEEEKRIVSSVKSVA